MLDDNQFASALEKMIGNRGFEPLNTLMRMPGNYEWMLKQKPQGYRLPMTKGQPNYVFADPGAGVIAIKQDEHILYCSLYWRARYAVNNLARVHHITPDSGAFYTVPDRTDQIFSHKFDDDYKKAGLHLADAGLRQPIAKVPSAEKDFRPGKENIHAGDELRKTDGHDPNPQSLPWL